MNEGELCVGLVEFTSTGSQAEIYWRGFHCPMRMPVAERNVFLACH